MNNGKYKEWLEPEKLILIQGWARDGLTYEQIAHNMGISRKTLGEWKNLYTPIRDALKKGREVVDREVENALVKSALGYQYTEITKERIKDSGQRKRHDTAQKYTDRDWGIAKAYFNNECCYCGARTTLTKDHLRPLDKGGQMDKDNIVPCCKECNSSKGTNEWLSWFEGQDFYEPERAKKIQNYMDFVLTLKADPSQDKGELVVTKEVTRDVPPNVTSIIFYLKNRKNAEWNDRQKQEADKADNDKVLEMIKYIKENDNAK